MVYSLLLFILCMVEFAFVYVFHGWVCFCLCCAWLCFIFSLFYRVFFLPCFANFRALFFLGHFGGPVFCFQQFVVSVYFQQIFVIVVLLFTLLIKSFCSSGILIDRALFCNFYLHWFLDSLPSINIPGLWHWLLDKAPHYPILTPAVYF